MCVKIFFLLFRQYLTGFSKRKAERKKVAHEREIEKLREEKRQIKKKVWYKKNQECYSKCVQSSWSSLMLSMCLHKITVKLIICNINSLTAGWFECEFRQAHFKLMGCAIKQQAITWANVDPDLLPYGVTRPQWVAGNEWQHEEIWKCISFTSCNVWFEILLPPCNTLLPRAIGPVAWPVFLTLLGLDILKLKVSYSNNHT